MTIVIENICAIVAFGEFFIGVLVNIFIGVVNSMDWVKFRRVSTLDFIITGIAISRTILLWVITHMTMLIAFYCNENYMNDLRILNALWNLGSVLSAWFDTCHSVYLFLKIANFSHPVFLWLKWRVDKVVLRILIGCLTVSLLICLLVTEEMNSIYSDQINKANITEKIQVSSSYYIFPIVFFYIGTCLPFSLCLISCFLLVLSLWRHTQQIQLHVTSSRDPNTEAHVKAMKFMVSFIFLFVLYYVAIIMAILNFYVFRNRLCVTFALIIMNTYPMVHSIILVLGNSKMRRASLKVLQKFKYCLRRAGNS